MIQSLDLHYRSKARRKSVERLLRIRKFTAACRDKTITDPWLAEDVSRRVAGLNLFSQACDKNAQVIGLVFAGRSPDAAQQYLVRKHTFRIARKQQQEIEFLGREVDAFAGEGHRVGVGINDKVSHFDVLQDGFRRCVGGVASFGSGARVLRDDVQVDLGSLRHKLLDGKVVEVLFEAAESGTAKDGLGNTMLCHKGGGG